MDVKISVIIPVYNAEDFLGAALDSVLGQSLQEIEVICVNDGSTDRSEEILQTYSRKDRRVIPVFQENSGPSAARNNGIARARGKYIQFLDSDDLLGSMDALECLFEKAESEGLDQLFFDADSFYESAELEQAYSNFASFYQRKIDYPESKEGRQLFADMQENWDFKVSPVLQLLRKGFLAENGLCFCGDMRNHEDEVFTLQASILAARAGHLKKSFYKRRVREGSQGMQANEIRGIIDLYHGIKRLIDFGGTHLPDAQDRVYAAYFTRVRVLQEMAGRHCAAASSDKNPEWIRAINPAERADFTAYLYAWEYLARVKEENRQLRNKRRMQEERILELKEQLGTVREKYKRVNERKAELKSKLEDQKAVHKEQLVVIRELNQQIKDYNTRVRELERQVYELRHPVKHVAKKVLGKDKKQGGSDV